MDINAVECTGRTALHGAAQKGYDEVVRFLAERGAKLDAKDRKGRTPLDAAMGLLGNGGFDGSRADVHESTAALIKQFIGTRFGEPMTRIGRLGLQRSARPFGNFGQRSTTGLPNLLNLYFDVTTSQLRRYLT